MRAELASLDSRAFATRCHSCPPLCALRFARLAMMPWSVSRDLRRTDEVGEPLSIRATEIRIAG